MRLLELPQPSYDVRHRLRSADGWPLALYEYRPQGETRSSVPVLCVHGLNCRYGIFDGGAGFGLAPYLSRHGIHTFAIDLRGRGLSAPRGRLQRASALIRRGWTLDDFLYRDIPRAIEATLEFTGARQLDVIGHSLGGMLLLELLSETQDPRVRRVVTVGSGDAPAMLLPPPREAQGQRQVNVGLLLAPFALSARYAPVHWGARLAALVLPLAPAAARRRWIDPMLDTLLNASNVEPFVLRTFLARSLSGISARKFWSFGRLVRRLHKTPHGSVRHHHATLFLGGARDGLVSCEKVRQTRGRAVHPASRIVELSVANGYAADYGHVDLLLGRHATRDVFPLIEQWLSALPS